jgi:outer membrane receptor protein involved in Fe transport
MKTFRRVAAPSLVRPEGLQSEEIVVTGRAPTVDATSSTVQFTVDAKTAERVPLIRPSSRGSATRSIESVAEIAPGAHGDSYGVSFNGATSPENAYQIDGLSVGNTAYGILGSPLSIEFVKEVNVITGGYMPEYARPLRTSRRPSPTTGSSRRATRSRS